MYDNIGGKIKGLAKALCIIDAILCIVLGIVLIATDESLVIYGIVVLLCGPILAFISSWALYAFGELVADMHAVRIKYCNEKAEGTVQSSKQSAKENKPVHNPKSFVKKKEPKVNISVAQPTVKNHEAKKEISLTQNGMGYICPVCKTANDSFLPCTICNYVPPVENAEVREVLKVEYIDITCPKCREPLSVMEGEEHIVCPWCNSQLDIR